METEDQKIRQIAMMIQDRFFSSKNFKGKSISEYRLPESLFENVKNDPKSEEILVCFSRKQGCASYMQIVFLAPFFLVGFIVIGYGLYQLFDYFTGSGSEPGDALSLLIFGIIWTAVLYFASVRSIIKKSLFTYWFKIKPEGFECFYGKKFDPNKAAKFSLSDYPTFTKDGHRVSTGSRHDRSEITIHELYITDQNQKFHLNDMSAVQADYIYDFLNYHLKQEKQKLENPNVDDWNIV